MPGRRTGFVIRRLSNIFAVARSCRTKLRSDNRRNDQITEIIEWQIRTRALDYEFPRFNRWLRYFRQSCLPYSKMKLIFFRRHSKYFSGRRQNGHIHCAQYIYIYQIVTQYPGIRVGKSRTIVSMNILMGLYNALFDWNIDYRSLAFHKKKKRS